MADATSSASADHNGGGGEEGIKGEFALSIVRLVGWASLQFSLLVVCLFVLVIR